MGLKLRPVLHRFYRPIADYVLVGMEITQVFAVRLAILALPFSLHPSWIILPFTLAFAFAVTITASTFKKYL